MTKKKEKEGLSGLMEDLMKETGKTVNSMALACIELLMATKKLGNGRRGREFVGLKALFD